MVSRHNDSFVTCAGGHRGQSVHVLCAADTWYAVKRESGNALSRQFLHHLVVHRRCGVDKGDEVLPFVHQFHFVFAELLVEQRLLYLQNEFRLCVDVLGFRHHLCTCSCILFVMIECAVTCMVLDKNGEAVLHKLTYCFRRACHAVLAVHNLFWDTNNHNWFCVEFSESFIHYEARADSVVLAAYT